MTGNSPRIPPLLPEDFTQEQTELTGGWNDYVFARVMVQHPDLYRPYIPFGSRIMRGSSLPERDREILVLRTVALCGDNYERAHHVQIARQIGMTDTDIKAALSGAPALAPFEEKLVKAAEELVRDHFLSDKTWKALNQRYSMPQMMEVVFLVGNFTLLSMVTNSFGIPLEEGLETI